MHQKSLPEREAFFGIYSNGNAVVAAVSGSTKTSSLGWKQVSPSGTTDYPQGYVLTSHSGLTPDEDDDNSSTGDDDNGSGSAKTCTWQSIGVAACGQNTRCQQSQLTQGLKPGQICNASQEGTVKRYGCVEFECTPYPGIMCADYDQVKCVCK